MEKSNTNKALIDKRQLLAMIPLCERTILNFEKDGKFPRRIVLSRRKVVWDLEEVEAWIEARKGTREATHPEGGPE